MIGSRVAARCGEGPRGRSSARRRQMAHMDGARNPCAQESWVPGATVQRLLRSDCRPRSEMPCAIMSFGARRPRALLGQVRPGRRRAAPGERRAPNVRDGFAGQGRSRRAGADPNQVQRPSRRKSAWSSRAGGCRAGSERPPAATAAAFEPPAIRRARPRPGPTALRCGPTPPRPPPVRRRGPAGRSGAADRTSPDAASPPCAPEPRRRSGDSPSIRRSRRRLAAWTMVAMLSRRNAAPPSPRSALNATLWPSASLPEGSICSSWARSAPKSRLRPWARRVGSAAWAMVIETDARSRTDSATVSQKGL